MTINITCMKFMNKYSWVLKKMNFFSSLREIFLGFEN